MDPGGLIPRSHQSTDTADALDRGPIDEIVELTLLLTDAIDAYIAQLDDSPGRQRIAPKRLWSRA